MGGRASDVIGHLELGGRVLYVERRPGRAAAPAAGCAAFAVCDEGDVDKACRDGSGGVLDVDHEGRTTDGGAVCILRLNAEVFGDLESGRPAG